MKPIANWLLSGVLFGSIAGLGVTGCGETEETYSCEEICQTFSDCAEELGFDRPGRGRRPLANATECMSSCENEAVRAQDFAEKADSCQSCLSAGDSCNENYGCVEQCADVLPEVVL